LLAKNNAKRPQRARHRDHFVLRTREGNRVFDCATCSYEIASTPGDKAQVQRAHPDSGRVNQIPRDLQALVEAGCRQVQFSRLPRQSAGGDQRTGARGIVGVRIGQQLHSQIQPLALDHADATVRAVKRLAGSDAAVSVKVAAAPLNCAPTSGVISKGEPTIARGGATLAWTSVEYEMATPVL
jgi:hypothetical protein